MPKLLQNKHLQLFLLSLVVRLMFLILIKGIDSPPQGDEGGYIKLGDYLLGKAPESFFIFRAPLAGFIFTPFFLIFGSTSQIARLVNVFISSVFAPLIFSILKIKFDKEKPSFYLSLFWVFYPPSIFYSSMITSETLAGLLILIFIFVFQKNEMKIKINNFIYLGILCGLISLTRSSYYYLPFFILFFFIYKYQLELIKAYLLFILSFYATLSPIIVYNYQTFGSFLPSEPRLGYGLYLCNNDLNNPEIKKGGYFRDEYLKQRKVNYNNLKDMYLDDISLKEKTLEYMSENKTKLITPMINRYLNFWSFRPNPMKNSYTINDIIMFFVWLPILFLYCFTLLSRRLNVIELLNLIIFYTSITVLPFWGIARFRFPVDSLIFIKIFTYINRKFIDKDFK